MHKRLLDIGLALLGLTLFSPLLLVLALLVKVGSPGPVLYRGLRVGRFGKPFQVLKFRSMVACGEQMGGSSTADGDPRITALGRVLRKLKLDELPQLVNVLRGEMSFVGPRPEVPEHVASYTAQEKLILDLRPGITDWATVWNSDEGAVLAGADDPDEAYLRLIRPTKLKLQLVYRRNHGMWVDLKIISYTLLRMFARSWLPPELRLYGNPLAPARDGRP